MKLNDLIQAYPVGQRKKVVVPKANNEEIIHCIGDAISKKLADFILIGEKDKILKVAADHQIDISQAEFVEEADDAEACQLAARLCKEGKADVLMKGLVQTSTFTKAILNKEIGLIEDGRLISHVSVFELPGFEQLVFLTDAAINIAPDVQDKGRILKNVLTMTEKFGISQPKVAALSAVEKVSPKMQSTVDADELAKMAEKGEFGNVLLEGPLAFDAAISREAAEIKGISSQIAGSPDILLCPNIEAANMLYKCLTKLLHAPVAGTLVGVNVPVVLTSRADSEETKLLSLGLGIKLAH
ncbi:MAG: bifunctional enoyl-CoA hydratase/phosphate acetyltransferase [Spirochaetes bacterium]|nr:bifunctional enoyl-CoA hydratase/phosphate acetyltransferase [Spirochaetota bacterium]